MNIKIKGLLVFTGFFVLMMGLVNCHNPNLLKLHTYVVEQPSNDEPVTVYSHGYLCNQWIANIYHRTIKNSNRFNSSAFILGPLVSFHYADWANPLRTNLGQEADMERLHHICKNYKQVVLVGTSRGAATIINYLATYKPKNILGAVLESPFDSIDSVADYILANARIKNTKRAKDTLHSLFFKKFDREGIQPIKVAHTISHDIPILLICSKKDSLISYQSTTNIYEALKNTGHPKAHLLTCDNGVHGLIMWSKDGKKLRNVIHAFYKHYNLPHFHEEWAQDGAHVFSQLIS